VCKKHEGTFTGIFSSKFNFFFWIIIRTYDGGFLPLPRSTCSTSTFSEMKFFIDTANLAQIQEAMDLGILDGVTTNPSLMAKEGITGEGNIMRHYRAICDLVGDGDVSAEVIATDFNGMTIEGERLADIAENIVVKVPMTRDGIKAIRYFADRDIATNCTLVFSAGQAILAAKAGATYLSPFVGRIDDINWDGIGLLHEIAEIYAIQGFDTELLAASIRSSLHIVEAAKAGADVVTCPLDAILGLLRHPLTDLGLEKFLADHRALEGKKKGKTS
jgi:transaldolase